MGWALQVIWVDTWAVQVIWVGTWALQVIWVDTWALHVIGWIHGIYVLQVIWVGTWACCWERVWWLCVSCWICSFTTVLGNEMRTKAYKYMRRRTELRLQVVVSGHCIDRPRPAHNGRHFTDIFSCILLMENHCILVQISLIFSPKGSIVHKSALLWVVPRCR